ncbi:precorrin-6Y C5,15-methyltransferase (decarboxylating) subunit CbiT [Thermovenabulum gondwanense]|uniref:Cobalt-precorrin-6B C(15)-methyltransferase (Decarboxylating) n=1 Tax=Thermovenabulum gondwanense TaxID=520767 RepID=A0A162MRN4_9FIRM|nr:precorrin-6Y C5,15-methyltransferase (decarboxylating) subunit CbiT [Thermovenabulum gondwanense]KYO67026.1 Cobalt-precorrin-6B C(15)-methyltransferase (decarboxylating) [Thermovenabulum gondwanense]
MWIKDEEFIRGNIPMTKFEVRAVTLSYLDISTGDVLLDLGAGTGSISVQSALLGAKVIAVDREKEAVRLIEENARKFNVTIEIFEGEAVQAVGRFNFNKCFIGGSGGNIGAILEAVNNRLPPGGVVGANFIKPENAWKFHERLKILNYEVDSCMVSVVRMDERGIYKALTPVIIVRAKKGGLGWAYFTV